MYIYTHIYIYIYTSTLNPRTLLPQLNCMKPCALHLPRSLFFFFFITLTPRVE